MAVPPQWRVWGNRLKSLGRTQHGEYFAGIDGLRAVAVLSVLLYHLNALIPAGFVGVDVFFVISGFVVAAAAADLPGDRFGAFLTSFYARRLLRIAPALIVCLLVSMLVMALIVPVAPDGVLGEMNTKTGLAAFFGFSNMVLAFSANDYWSPRSEFNPFTHTWSLGVEEQFYLVFPFLYFMWLRGRRRLAAGVLAGLMALSLLSAIRWVDAGPLAFYSLPTRFWELGIGVALYFTIGRWRPLVASFSSGARELFAGSAALGLVAGFLLAESQRFPWPWALLPVLSTALLIMAVVGSPGSWVARGLATAPMVKIGKMSYSLYLWHWPLIVFARWTSGMDSAAEVVIVGLLSFVFAWLSYSFVEQPLRQSPVMRTLSRRRLVAIMLVVTGVGTAGAVGVAFARPSLSLTAASDRLLWRWDGELSGPRVKCGVLRSSAPFSNGREFNLFPESCARHERTVFVAGDSHAGAYMAMLDLYARESATPVRIFTRPGCGAFNLRAPLASGSAECRVFVETMLAEVKARARPGDLLFLPGLRVARYQDQWGRGRNVSTPIQYEDRPAAVEEAVLMLAAISQAGVRVVFEAPKPVFKAPPFRCADWFNSANPICKPGQSVPRAELDFLRMPVLQAMSDVVARLPHSAVWDPFPMLCAGEVCSAYQGDKPLFFDGDHLSGFGNQVLGPSFARFVENL